MRACTHADHDALRADRAAFEAATVFVAFFDGVNEQGEDVRCAMANCLACDSTIALEVGQ